MTSESALVSWTHVRVRTRTCVHAHAHNFFYQIKKRWLKDLDKCKTQITPTSCEKGRWLRLWFKVQNCNKTWFGLFLLLYDIKITCIECEGNRTASSIRTSSLGFLLQKYYPQVLRIKDHGGYFTRITQVTFSGQKQSLLDIFGPLLP